MVNVPSSEPDPACPRTGGIHLPAGEIHLWSLCAELWQPHVPWLADVLAEDERQRAARFHRERDRLAFVVSRALLRHVLARAYLHADPASLVFGTGPSGKPHLLHPAVHPPLHFNLAHSDAAILLAIARHEVGVDVERIRSDVPWQDIAGQVFTAEEQQTLQQLPRDRRMRGFFMGWTRKEAYVKARGGGLSIPLQSFSVSLDAAEPRLVVPTDPGEARHWFLADIESPQDFAAAVAARMPVARCRRFAARRRQEPDGIAYCEM